MCTRKRVCVVCVGVSISEHARTSVGRYVYESVYIDTDKSVCMCV